MSNYERPSGPNKSTNDQRITLCKICWYSILVGQPRMWLTHPMGLSHTACVARAGLR